MDTSEEFAAWFGIGDADHPDLTAMTDEAVRQWAVDRIEFLFERSLIDRGDYNTLQNTVPTDVDYFLAGSHSATELEKPADRRLTKLGRLHLDTEAREFIAELYYDLARRKGLEQTFGDKLMEWLYGRELMELSRSLRDTVAD